MKIVVAADSFKGSMRSDEAGSIIAEGRITFQDTPHMVFMPAIVLFLTVLSLNFVGDQLLKRFDIRESAL